MVADTIGVAVVPIAKAEEILELAREQGVPPYVIFHDATLTELAHARPRSITEFAAIPGVGQAKLQRYADAFLEVIEQHVE